MIVTVTPNPSLDRAISLAERLAPGEVQRATGDREDAGGKGINVSRALVAAGRETRALFPAAASDPFVALVEAAGVSALPIAVSARVRSNITLTDPAGLTTKVNLPGAESIAGAADLLIAAIVAAAEGAAWLVLAGSLPPGVPDDFFARVTRAVRERFSGDAPRIAVDTSGPPLAVAVRAHPDLIKPNGEELAELLGEESGADAEEPAIAFARARRVAPGLVGAALVTLGARGALWVDGRSAFYAPAPAITVRSTVGAGDSSLAGYLIADQEGAAPEHRLARAVAYGAAAASLPGTQVPTPADAGIPVAVTAWAAPAAR